MFQSVGSDDSQTAARRPGECEAAGSRQRKQRHYIVLSKPTRLHSQKHSFNLTVK